MLLHHHIRRYAIFLLPAVLLTTCTTSLFAACYRHNSNPYSYSALMEYYKDAYGKDGEELRLALHNIIKGHKYQSYSCVYTILEETDRDRDNPDNVILLYTRRSEHKDHKDKGSPQDYSWNREHVWPKSNGFPSKGQHGYTDLHHLRPADAQCNSERSNYEFSDGGYATSKCDGKGLKTYNTWFPGDEVKGDVARMIFYMEVRYEGADPSDGGMPDLTLSDSITSSSDASLGKLCTLYKWHHDDPVSRQEMRRNNVIYNWQGNRNPFIDHPEAVEMIWSSVCEQQ